VGHVLWLGSRRSTSDPGKSASSPQSIRNPRIDAKRAAVSPPIPVPTSLVMDGLRSVLAIPRQDSYLKAAVYRSLRYITRDPVLVEVFGRLVRGALGFLDHAWRGLTLSVSRPAAPGDLCDPVARAGGVGQRHRLGAARGAQALPQAA
jgi:hypothetical protein